MHEVTTSLDADQVARIVRIEINEALYELLDRLDERKGDSDFPVFVDDVYEDIHQIEKHIEALTLTFKYLVGRDL